MNILIPWMDCFINVIPERPYKNIWTDREDILVKTEAAANAIADLIEALYRADGKDITVCTGYYDPEEDKQRDVVDKYTGWWYVRIN